MDKEELQENHHENKTLKATKQDTMAKLGRTSMGYVLKVVGQKTAKV